MNRSKQVGDQAARDSYEQCGCYKRNLHTVRLEGWKVACREFDGWEEERDLCAQPRNLCAWTPRESWACLATENTREVLRRQERFTREVLFLVNVE